MKIVKIINSIIGKQINTIKSQCLTNTNITQLRMLTFAY